MKSAASPRPPKQARSAKLPEPAKSSKSAKPSTSAKPGDAATSSRGSGPTKKSKAKRPAERAAAPAGRNGSLRSDQFGAIFAKGLDLAEASLSLGLTMITRVGAAAQQQVERLASALPQEPPPRWIRGFDKPRRRNRLDP